MLPMANYDPDTKASVDPRQAEEARQFGLQPVNVICDEPGAKVGDHTGVSFIAFVPSVPSQGDRIVLEDRTACDVVRVIWKVSRPPGEALVMLVPNVIAVRVSPERVEKSG